MKKISCGKKEIILGERTLIMGILNVTPDSFSDGGKYNNLDAAMKQAEKLIADGADIIDIGGESTRPGHTQITVEEEISRVVPIVEKISKELNTIISIDTYKHEVAKEAVKAGADIINDIWGLQYDKGEMAKFVKECNLPLIAMHNQNDEVYNKDIMLVLREFFAELPRATPTDFLINVNNLVTLPVSQGDLSQFALAQRLDETFLYIENNLKGIEKMPVEGEK